MKKLIVLATLVISSVTFGQENRNEKREHHRKGKMEMMKDLSPEQMATLRTKKMTLSLDLTNIQQDKMYALHLEGAKARKKKMEERTKNKGDEKPKLSSEEKYSKMNQRLDKQIEVKNRVKVILTKEQFEKWEAYKRNKPKQRMRKKHRD